MEHDQIGVDSSDVYIKMCLGAVELQRIHQVGFNPNKLNLMMGDYYLPFTTALDTEDIQMVKQDGDYEQVIWLPMLHQLINLFNAGSAIEVFRALAIHSVKDPLPSYLQKVNDRSGEQLVLAWFMRQTYQKIWNGQAWIEFQ